jgi:hypothetical protein
MRTRTALAAGVLLIAALGGCSAKGGSGGVATAASGPAKPAASGPSAAAGLSPQELAARFGQCMRANGVPDFADPKINANGGTSIDIPEGTDPQKAQAAQEKCRQYTPNGGEPQKLDPQRIEQLRTLAKCMRDHGVKNFPDPTDQGIQVNGNDSGLNPDDPTFKAAMQECAKYGPSPAPGEGPAVNQGNG